MAGYGQGLDKMNSQLDDTGCSHGQEWTSTKDEIQNYQVDGPRRRKRMHFSKAQLDTLELFFQSNRYPDIDHREDLAKRLCIQESRVQVWFQNRRAKAKRRNEIPTSNTPKVEYFEDQLVPQHQNVLHQSNMVANNVTILNSESHFLPLPPSTSYHPYSYPSPQAQKVPSNVYCQNVSYSTNMELHQVYKNQTGIETTDLNDRSSPFSQLF